MDTNAVLDLVKGRLPASGKSFLFEVDPCISVITHIELLSPPQIPLDELQLLVDFIEIATIYPLDQEVIQQTISLRQKHKIKTPDAIIAATAIVQELTLITRNISDFKKIIELQSLNLHEM